MITEIAIDAMLKVAETAPKGPNGLRSADLPNPLHGGGSIRLCLNENGEVVVETKGSGIGRVMNQFVNFEFSASGEEHRCTFRGEREQFIPLICDYIEFMTEGAADASAAWEMVLERAEATLKRRRDDRSSQVGLLGELAVMNDMLLRGSKGIVSAWQRDDDRLHDFIGRTAKIEVKTSTMSGQSRYEISSLEQLEVPSKGTLYFAAVHLKQKSTIDEGATLVSEFLEMVRKNVPIQDRTRFENQLAERLQAGDTLAFDLSSLKITYYKVMGEFPRLTSSDIHEQIARGVDVRSYGISLSGANSLRLSEIEIKKLSEQV